MSDIEERFAALDRAIAELKREVMATNWKAHNRTDQMPCDPSASVVILSKDNFIHGPARADSFKWDQVTDWRYAKTGE